MEHSHCQHGDRHTPGIRCGYLLPCPWHTLTVDLTGSPTVVSQPATVRITDKQRRRVMRIADVMSKDLRG